MATRYYISLPDPAAIRDPANPFAFRAHGADAFAEELQEALRSRLLHDRWRAAQPDPDAIDPTFADTDPDATVTGEQNDLHVDLVVTTTLPSTLLRHRLGLLAGNHWQLRDVRAA